jgi:hypothetical protein
MARRSKEEPRLSFPEKLSRLKQRIKDPEWQRYGKMLLLGKFSGLALVLGFIAVSSYT